MLEKMEKRIRTGEDAEGHVIEVPAWQISDRCKELRRVIPVVKRDEKDVEKIEACNDGSDSPLQGAGYGLYAIFGEPAEKPRQVQLVETLEPLATNTQRYIEHKKFDIAWEKAHQPVRRKLRWTRPGIPQG